MAWDTGNDKMVVPASDGPRNVGGTHKNHPERLSMTSCVLRTNAALPGPHGHVLTSFGFSTKLTI